MIPDNENTPREHNTPQRRSWLRRYLTLPTLIAVGIIVYLTLFSENSVSQRVAYQQIIDSLQIELRAQEDSLALYRNLNERLSKDPELMEQVVREQYNMNRPHEDVFVVTTE